MNDFLQMIMPYVLPLIIAAVGYAVTYLKVKNHDLLLNQLEEIIKNEGEHYYIICDKCGNKIQLSKAKLPMLLTPSGIVMVLRDVQP